MARPVGSRNVSPKRLSSMLNIGYKIVGNHLIRNNSDGTKTIVVMYSRYVNTDYTGPPPRR